ncbi:MAG: hypothetical protein WC313_06460 [Candidatus Kapaibacterium sp.]|jgi:YVTN family beta-propeller protein|nr:hypothetical protein [Candidatus Kapabacteria bacterium]
MKYTLLAIFAMMLISSCSTDEKIINSIDESDKMILALNSENPGLVLIEVPSMKVIDDDFAKNTIGIDLESPITNIKEYGTNMYMFAPESHKIYIISKTDMKLVIIIDFSSDLLEPYDIVFPNSTDAYIVHNNSDYVTLFDLTEFVAARQIKVGNPPHSIAMFGNFVFVSNMPDNNISVIDTRLRQELATIPTEAVPSHLAVSHDGKHLICISAGNGKFNQGAEKSPAYYQFIEISTRTVVHSAELGFGAIVASEQIPLGLIVTLHDWGFVITNDNLIRIDIRNMDRLNLVTKRNFHFINELKGKEKLMLLRFKDDGTDIMFADDRTGDIGDYYYVPYKVNFLFPI